MDHVALENEGRIFLRKVGTNLFRYAARMESSITPLRKPKNPHKPKRVSRNLLKFYTGLGGTQ
jgi:hypothetical protein